jgi:hypothetical protein
MKKSNKIYVQQFMKIIQWEQLMTYKNVLLGMYRLYHYQVQFLLILQQQQQLHDRNLVYQQNDIIGQEILIEEEELNSELEDSDNEFNLKNKQQKFNPNLIRNKIIKIFKRKPNQSTNTQTRNTNRTTTNQTNLSLQQDRFIIDRQSDIEEDPPSDLSDSTIPVDQWSIESVPKPGFTPVEHLQVLKFVS